MSCRAVLAALPLLLAAADAPSLQPGLWEIRNEPGVAMLDGRKLDDLPLEPIQSEQVCVTSAEAADPAAWFARDNAETCTLDRRDVAAGAVDIAGSCAPADEGQPRGALTLKGRWTPATFDLRFETTSHGENGTMQFSGTMVGRRVGDCTG